MNQAFLKRILFLFPGVFLFLGAVTAPPEKEPATPTFPHGGYQALTEDLKGFAFHSKREITLVRAGISRKRWDKVDLERDANGSTHVKKSGSEKRSDLEFIWVKQNVYRPDLKRLFDPVSSETIYEPVFDRLTSYWDEFWQENRNNLAWQRKSTVTWDGRACDRFVISNAKEQNSGQVQILGEFLVDQKTGLVLQANLVARYFEKPSPEILALLKAPPAATAKPEKTPKSSDEIQELQAEIPEKKDPSEIPFEITFHVHDEVHQIGKVAVIQIPDNH